MSFLSPPNPPGEGPNDFLARRQYEVYCQAVGGVAFNGTPLPSWDEFVNDPEKQKQVHGWREVARATIYWFTS